MKYRALLGFILLVYIVLAAAAVSVDAAAKKRIMPAIAPRTAPTTPTIDTRATQMLRQMSDYLASLSQFTTHVNSSMEVITPTGQVLNSDRSMDVSVIRPDHLRIDSHVPDHDRQYFYDGRTLTIYSPKQNVYTVIDAPPTIDGLIDLARQRGVQLPLADFLLSDPYTGLMANTVSAIYVGQSQIGDILTNQLAFQRSGLEWQLWIENSPTPFPRRVSIVDKSVPGNPRFVATMTCWNPNPVLDPSIFTFVPPAGAKSIPFGRPELAPSSGGRGPGK